MNISIRLKKAWKPPAFKVDEKLLADATAIVSASILRNIVQQKQASGAALKRNSPGTLRAKRAAGLGTRALVAALHRFVQAGSWVRQSWNGRVLRIGAGNAELAGLVRSVMARGYTGWLGVDAKGMAALKAALRAFGKRELARSKR